MRRSFLALAIVPPLVALLALAGAQARGDAAQRLGSALEKMESTDQPVDPDSRGTVEVEIGLFDGLIRRQTLRVVEPADPLSGTGLDAVRTTYTVEYWDHGRDLEVREPK